MNAPQRTDHRQARHVGAMPVQTPEPISVTVNRAAEISGLGISTIWALIAAKRLDTTSVGRRRLVTYRSLKALCTGDGGA
jgi:hypothetical protein